MHLNITTGCAMLVLTTIIHALAMMAAVRGIKRAHTTHWAREAALKKMSVVAALVVVMFFASVLEAGLWAATYLALGALSEVEEACYFSMVTYTTLGFGDVTLTGGWRLLSAFEAANGIIMFGWTTALIFAAVQRVYFPHGAPDDPTAKEKRDV